MLFVKNSKNITFAHFLFFHNIVKKLSWARGLAMYTNTSSATGPTYPPTQHLLYHHNMRSCQKMMALPILVPQ